MKKTKLAKVSKQKISVIQRNLWVECKRIIRARYNHTCYTCERNVRGANMHTGHFIPKASLGAYLKYDLRVLRLQCYNCNINLGGNGAVFYTNMVKREGQEYVDNIMRDRLITVKAYDHYLKLLEEYKQIKK